MKSIEFRAWDKINKKWLEFQEIKERLIFNEFSGLFTKDDPSFFIDNSGNFDIGLEIELVRFTGLLDKNGKKIFEGDIIKSGIKWSNATKLVEWINSECRFNISRKPRMHSKNHSWEIIGNKYENPELLNVLR